MGDGLAVFGKEAVFSERTNADVLLQEVGDKAGAGFGLGPDVRAEVVGAPVRVRPLAWEEELFVLRLGEAKHLAGAPAKGAVIEVGAVQKQVLLAELTAQQQRVPGDAALESFGSDIVLKYGAGVSGGGPLGRAESLRLGQDVVVHVLQKGSIHGRGSLQRE